MTHKDSILAKNVQGCSVGLRAGSRNTHTSINGDATQVQSTHPPYIHGLFFCLLFIPSLLLRAAVPAFTVVSSFVRTSHHDIVEGHFLLES